MKALLAIAATAALTASGLAVEQANTPVADAAASAETSNTNDVLSGMTARERLALQKVGIWRELAFREYGMLNKDADPGEMYLDVSRQINYDGTPARFQKVMKKLVAHMESIKGDDRIEQLGRVDPEKVVGSQDNEYMQAIAENIWFGLDLYTFLQPYEPRLAGLDAANNEEQTQIKAIFREAAEKAYALIDQGNFPKISGEDGSSASFEDEPAPEPLEITERERKAVNRVFIMMQIAMWEHEVLQRSLEPDQFIDMLGKTDFADTPPRFREIMQQRMVGQYRALKEGDPHEKMGQIERSIDESDDGRYLKRLAWATSLTLDLDTFLEPYMKRLGECDPDKPEDAARIKSVIDEAKAKAAELIAAGQFPLHDSSEPVSDETTGSAKQQEP